MMLKAAVVLSALSVAFAQVTVNTPASLTTCVPVQLSWSATTGPYYLSILPGGQPSAAPLEQLGTFTTTSYTWTVNLAAGTSVTITVTDASGTPNYSDQVTILAGTSSSCVGQAASAAAGGTAAAGTAAAATAAGSTAAGSAISSVVSAASTAAAAATTRATSASTPASSAATTTRASSASSTPTGAAANVAAGSAFGLVAAALAVAMA